MPPRPYRDLQATYIKCRTGLRHRWDDVTGLGLVELPNERYGEPWILRCARCKTIRAMIVSVINGFLLYTRYIHPKDYRLDKYEGALTLGQELRREFVLRRREEQETA